ncbi:MAG: lasso peptide biosynthesis B2 protein [Pseudomonadota bacterium]
MLTKLRKFLNLNKADKLVLLKAWFLLGYYRARILLFPFKRLTKYLEHHRQTVEPPAVAFEQIKRAQRIGYLVSLAATVTPWQSRCLVQVLVTQRLMAAQYIPGQFYLGLHQNSRPNDEQNSLFAHAWLQCGDSVVSGAAGHEAFTAVSTFVWGARGD